MRTQVIAEDRDCLVCFKPAGLAVQSRKVGEADMVSELKNYLAQKGEGSYLGLVHRLDQPVSGLLVFAKNSEAAAVLSAQAGGPGRLGGRSLAGKDIRGKDGDFMEKTYRAIAYTCGRPLASEGKLVDYIVKDAVGGARIVAAGQKGAKRAELYYRCLDRREDRTLLQITLLTGRHHQIRAQLAKVGAPLLGDLRYGSKESINYSREKEIRMVQLQAVRLCFTHPSTKERVCYELDQALALAF